MQRAGGRAGGYPVGGRQTAVPMYPRARGAADRYLGLACNSILSRGTPPPPSPPHCQVRFLSTNKRLHRLGNSSTALWAELHKELKSPREAELFGIWLRPKAQLVQRLGLYFCQDDAQAAEEEEEAEAWRSWEAAQSFTLGCIAGSTSLRGLALVSEEGELRAGTWCAALPSLRWVRKSERVPQHLLF